MAKFQKSNDYSPYEEIPMEEVDPEGKLPPIQGNGIKPPTNPSAIGKLMRNFEKVTRDIETDEECFQRPKRKISPSKEERRQKSRENTPEKIGSRIVNKLNTSNNSNESVEEVDDTVVEAASHDEPNGAASLLLNLLPNLLPKTPTRISDEPPMIDNSSAINVSKSF